MIVTIEVRQEHIDRGVRGSTAQCPVALAAKQQMPEQLGYHTQGVAVLGDSIEWGRHGIFWRGQRTSLPFVARTMIRLFDSGTPISPFTFHIEVPDEWTSGETVEMPAVAEVSA